MRSFRASCALVLLPALAGPAAAQQPFNNNSIVVLTAGDGLSSLTAGSAPIQMREYFPTGTLVQNYYLPTTGANRLMISGSSGAGEGLMTISPNGNQIAVGGYDAAPATTNVNSSASAIVNRSFGTIAVGSGVYTESYQSITKFDGGPVRGAFTRDSGSIWASGGPSSGTTNGVNAFSSSFPDGEQLAGGNFRAVNAFGNNIYATRATGTTRGIFTIGAGLPITGAQTVTNVVSTGSGSSPQAFVFSEDRNTVYIADDRSNTNGGIQKWTFAGTWSLAYTLAVGGSSGAYGLAVDFTTGPNPILYATTLDNRLVSIADSGALSVYTDLATAPTDTLFRGVVFVPVPEPATVLGLAALGLAAARFACRRRPV